MARPTKRTPAVEKLVVDASRLGATQRLACAYAGISEDTLARWRTRFAGFADRLTRAQGELALGLLLKIEAAASVDWRAAAWKLERRFPTEYGRQNLTLAGDPESPLTVLRAMPESDFDVLLQTRLLEAGYTRAVPVLEGSPEPAHETS